MKNSSQNQQQPSCEAAALPTQEQLLQELLYSNERFRLAAEISSEIILDYNLRDDSIYHVSSRVSTLYGIPQLLAHAPEQLISCGAVLPESAPVFLDLFHKIRTGAPQAACMVKCRTASGEIRWNHIIFTTQFDENDRPFRAIGVLKDITSQRVAELQCESERQHRNAIKKDALLYYEADLTNRKMLFGLEGLLRARGLPHTDRYEEALKLLTSTLVYAEDQLLVRETFAPENLLRQHAAGKDRMELEYRRIGEQHAPFWVRGTAYLADDPQGGFTRVFYYVNDINDEKVRQLELEEQARKDLLTNVYNKGTTEALIQEAVAAAPEGRCGALFIVDLDDFKQVNDQLGHVYGDALLSETARKLTSFCRDNDIVGRIGGDEFALYLRSLGSEEVAGARADQICKALCVGQESPSARRGAGTVGVALQPRHGSTFGELYQKADLALYEAKRRGKNTWCVFYDELATQQERPPTVRAAIDCSEGKSFADNMTEYVFRILYESKDLSQAINGVMDLIAKRFHFSRGYLYTGDEFGNWVCSYEWCGMGVAPLPEPLRLLQGNQLPSVRQRLRSGELCFTASPGEPFEAEPSFPVLPGIQLRVQIALASRKHTSGFLGFDCYQPCTALTAEERTALRCAAQMLDVFLSEQMAVERQQDTVCLLQAVADSIQDCTYLVDPVTYRLHFTNHSTHQRLSQAVPGALCYEAIGGQDSPCEDCPVMRLTRSGIHEAKGAIFLKRDQLWANYHATMARLSDGKEYVLLNVSQFTQERKDPINGEFDLGAGAFTMDTTLYTALTQSTDDYLYMCDMSRNLFYFPQAMVEEFDLPGQIIEDAVPLWSTYIHESERAAFLQAMDDLLSGRTAVHNQEYRARNKDGNWLWLRCRGSLQRDENGTPTLFAGIITNLGKRTKIDPITGMPDKYAFESGVSALLAETPAAGALLLLGLDNFKHINNLYGWEYGDTVLRESAQRLQAALPPGIQLYRLDGDKFGVFFTQADAQTIEAYFADLSARFQHQHASGQQKYFCTVSGGYTLLSDAAVSFHALCKQAEYALDHTKATGKGRLSAYDNRFMRGQGRSLRLLELLQASVEQDFSGFELHYQPQVNAETHEVVGAEALLRWQCEKYGSVGPAEFVPLLEQTGLIQKVGMWVIRQAAKTALRWRKHNPDFTVNVNVSAVQFQDKTFYQQLFDLVQSGELLPASLHLELTESCITTGDRFLTAMFTALRTLDFRIEMDDFGTGYSSLSILKCAPADVVKIDRTFVQNITHSDFDVTFIRFVVNLCHTAGIRVCLEGVETPEEYDIVSSMGLDLIQGFLFGRPQNPADFETNFLRTPPPEENPPSETERI